MSVSCGFVVVFRLLARIRFVRALSAVFLGVLVRRFYAYEWNVFKLCRTNEGLIMFPYEYIVSAKCEI